MARDDHIPAGHGPAAPGHDNPDATVRLLIMAEHLLLYIAAFALLVTGAAVLVASAVAAILHPHLTWTERMVTSVEGILLFLIRPRRPRAASGSWTWPWTRGPHWCWSSPSRSPAGRRGGRMSRDAHKEGSAL